MRLLADDGQGTDDALRLTVPVLGLQDAVTVATSFAIQVSEGEATEATEGLDLPAALPGTGGLELLAGVGRLPAVLANARQIMEANVKYGQELHISKAYSGKQERTRIESKPIKMLFPKVLHNHVCSLCCSCFDTMLHRFIT